MPIHSNPRDTRQNILEAAAFVFSRDGYDKTTIAKICNLAKANIAAANYHFGDKEKLYLEVWEDCLCSTLKDFPSHGNLPPSASPKKRLKAFIQAKFNIIFSSEKSGRLAKLIFSEMNSPRPAIQEVFIRVITPERERLVGIITDLVSAEANDPNVIKCATSIMSMCLSHAHRRFGQGCHLSPEKSPIVFSGEELTEHVYIFSLAGIKATFAHTKK